eukprot:TRINITY_DN11154_c0_g1_i3.p1 TRINITY_DN11154_c0_g1~~TRINITY_DN11154_c0_g1_i3.p1  ORF type:complete len:137 (-),score=38.47 TRINITY_DN11154_c0_g1_i3:136-504(-)
MSLRKLAERMLSKLGYRSVLATNGVEAIHHYTRAPAEIDCVLMDVQMPEMDGYQATSRIRQSEIDHGWARVPIVCMSADADMDNQLRSRQAGMDLWLPKPFSMDRLDKVLMEGIQAFRHPST